MKESFIFYDSFLNAIDELDKETQLEVYQAITHYALRGEESSLNGVAKAIFHLIKPQIDANNKRYEDGCKGGRPKKEKTTGFENEKPLVLGNGTFEKPNVNVNENVNENVLSYESKEKKESELFLNSNSEKVDLFVLADKVKQEYKAVIGKDLLINLAEQEKLMSLYIATPDFLESLNPVMWSLKALQELWGKPKPEGIGYSPPFSWLLKENFQNYLDIRNGVYDEQIAKWRKEYRLKRSQELAKQLEAEEVCCG